MTVSELKSKAIDCSEGVKRVGGDEEIFLRLLDDFRRGHSGDFLKIRNGENADRVAHTIKSSAASIGAFELSDAAKKLDARYRNNESPLETEFEAFLAALTAVLGEIDEISPVREVRADGETDFAKARDLAERLMPLLKNNSFDAIDFTEEITETFKGAAGAELAEYVNDFEFASAIDVIEKFFGGFR